MYSVEWSFWINGNCMAVWLPESQKLLVGQIPLAAEYEAINDVMHALYMVYAPNQLNMEDFMETVVIKFVNRSAIPF